MIRDIIFLICELGQIFINYSNYVSLVYFTIKSFFYFTNKKEGKMSNQKAKDLSTASWINLIIGIYNIYCFSIGHLLFNLVIGTLNIGVWVFFRNPQTIMILSRINSNENKGN